MKKAERLVIELSDVFAKMQSLQLVGPCLLQTLLLFKPAVTSSVESEAIEALKWALLQEATLALEGYEEAGAITIGRSCYWICIAMFEVVINVGSRCR